MSCCHRLGCISLFDAERSFLRQWLTAHKPITVVFRLNAAALEGSIVRRREAMAAAPGVIVPGEVCHRGAIEWSAVESCLFVRSLQSDRYETLRVDELTPQNIAATLRRLRAIGREAGLAMHTPHDETEFSTSLENGDS